MYTVITGKNTKNTMVFDEWETLMLFLQKTTAKHVVLSPNIYTPVKQQLKQKRKRIEYTVNHTLRKH